MPSIKELEKEADDLSDRLETLLDETKTASLSEMHGSKAANSEGQKIIEVIKEVIRDGGSLEDFFKVIPVKNAVYAGAFSLDSDLDHVELTSVQWLTTLAASMGSLSFAGGFISYPLIMRSVGRASLIADMGAGARIGLRQAYREGRMLSRRGGASVLAREGNIARLGRMARVGRWIGRASAALAAVAAVVEIVGLIITEVRKKKYKKALQEEIIELKDATREVFSDRANFFYDDLQMKSLLANLDARMTVWKTTRKTSTSFRPMKRKKGDPEDTRGHAKKII